MDIVAVVLVGAFALLALADWTVIWRGPRRLRAVTKPSVTLALLAVAAFVGDMAGDARAAMIVAVVLCLVGDVCLLRDDETSFLAGLGSFALGHAAYVASALLIGVHWPRLAAAFPFLAVVIGGHAFAGTLQGAKRRGGGAMVAAVAVYAAVISAMVVTATGSGSVAAAAGAMLFATSDSIIGYSRFVAPVAGRDLAVMTTYHTGQALLVLGLIAAG